MATVTTDGGQSAAAAAGQTPAYIRMLALQQLPGCPDALVDSQLALTLKDFYTKTTGWRADLGPYAVPANDDLVYLNPLDQNGQIQFVDRAWLYPILGGNTRQWLKPSNFKIVGGDKNVPTIFFMQTPDQLVLYPVPDKSYGNVLFVSASLIPTINAVQLPDITFTHHLDAILAGLLARLYRMPKKPWTDDGLSADYSKTYRRELLVWRAFADRNYGPKGPQTFFPSFAGRGNQGGQKAVQG